jgi:hypothetical protein
LRDRDRDTGRSLTPRPGRVGLVLALDPAVLVVLHLVHPGDRVDLTGLVVPHLLGPVVPHLGVRVDLTVLLDPVVPHLLRLAVPHPGVRVDLMGRAVLHLLRPVVLHLVGMAPVDLAARVDLTSPVALTSRAVPVDRVDRTSRAVLLALAVLHLVDPVAPDRTVKVDLVSRVVLLDRLHRRTSKRVSTTEVGPRWAAPGMCHTASARRNTVRRLRPRNADSAGTVGLPPELSRLSGTDRRLRVAGTGRRLLAAGTPDGKGRLATWLWRRPISGPSATAATTPYRSSTRFSVDGASGFSVSGCRCTDLNAPSQDWPLVFNALTAKTGGQSSLVGSAGRR